MRNCAAFWFLINVNTSILGSFIKKTLVYIFFLPQDLVELAGPEEMKWPLKQLYTYNVQNGDAFILDEKVPLTRLRTKSASSTASSPASVSH